MVFDWILIKIYFTTNSSLNCYKFVLDFQMTRILAMKTSFKDRIDGKEGLDSYQWLRLYLKKMSSNELKVLLNGKIGVNVWNPISYDKKRVREEEEENWQK